MVRKNNASDLETPECNAPDSWADIDAGVWQSKKGRWAAPQHYMCSYMAMFPPELPHYFIKRFTEPGDTVLDPFCGRGTAPVEAAAQRRHGIGNDLNPLAVALTRGKLSNPSLDDVFVRLDELEARYDPSQWGHFSGAPRKIRMIFHINTLRQLMFLKRELDWSKTGTDAFLTAVLMGALHGSSKGFLSLPMPNTFSMGWGYIEGKVKEDPERWKCPDRDAFEVLRERVKRQLAKGRLTGSGDTIYGDVRNLDQKVEHGSVQLLFTSPPYLRVIKYGLYNWIRLWFLTDSGSHEEVDEVLDDTHALVEYLDFMRDTLTATLPLMDRERGISCWAIGDVKGLNLAWAVWHHAASRIEIEADDGSILRYKLIAIVEDNIPAEQKVTKIWKTTLYNIVVVGINDEEVEVIGRTDDESKAKRIAAEWEAVEGLRTEIRSEIVNDKSGKATPLDRILIIAPEKSNPEPLLGNSDLLWEPYSSEPIPPHIQTPSKLPLEIRGIESKTSIDFTSIRLSSYSGWCGGGDDYPKLLVVSILDKEKSREKIKSKHWDIDGTVREIKEVKIIRDTSQIVAHDKTLHKRVLGSNKKNQEEAQAIKDEVNMANNNSSRPIKLLLPGSQNTGQLRLYLSLSKSKFSSLEDAPSEIIKYLSAKTIGAKFSMEKDYSDIGGPSGEYDQSIIDWELENGLFDSPTKKNRRKGTLRIHYPSGNVSKIPDWENGREMYFTGHAMEECLKEIYCIPKTRSHTSGLDLALSSGQMIQIESLMTDISPTVEKVLEEKQIKKVQILGLILKKLGMDLDESHYSTGSTVTVSGLRAVYVGVTASTPNNETKESLLRGILETLGEDFDSETDMSNPGSTVQSLALMKILRGLNKFRLEPIRSSL